METGNYITFKEVADDFPVSSSDYVLSFNAPFRITTVLRSASHFVNRRYLLCSLLVHRINCTSNW